MTMVEGYVDGKSTRDEMRSFSLSTLRQASGVVEADGLAIDPRVQKVG